MIKLIGFVLLFGLLGGCTKNYVLPPESSPTGPTPIADLSHAIEFRCVGESNLVTIDYGTTEQGSTHVVTALPFAVILRTQKTSTFVTLRAAATGFGFLDCKILVDGIVFQEADQTVNDPIVEIGGTWHQ